jgi:membrane protein
MSDLVSNYVGYINIIRYSVVLFILFFGASALYYIIPNAKMTFKEVAPGAALTVILWVISGYLLSKYIIYYNQLTIVYGSLGSIILTLLFFYIINMIFIYGAEFNYLLNQYEAEEELKFTKE